MSAAPALHHRETGAGEPALVILHGLFGSGSNWLSIARHLSRMRRVILVDLRNHGLSPHVTEMHYAAMVADVINLFDKIGLSSVDLLGHSMGGKVAMLLAMRHADRVHRLLVADIAPVSYPMNEHDQVLHALLALDLDRITSRQQAFEHLEDSIPSPHTRQFLLTNLRSAPGAGLQWRIPLSILHQALPELGRFPVDISARHPGPALFLRGEHSRYVGEKQAKTVTDWFPDADLETLPGTGHWLHADDPETFTDLVEAFLGRRW